MASHLHPVFLRWRRLLLMAVLCSAAVTRVQCQQPAAPSQRLHDALATAQRGNVTLALTQVAALLRDYPGYVPALKLQAVLQEDSGNQPAAASSYTAALALTPDDPELQLKVGTIELVQGHNERAQALLSRYSKAQPKDEEGLYYLAQADYRQGNDADALTAIKRAAALAPDSAPIAQKYGELLCSTGDNAAALTQLIRAQKAEPHLPRIDFDLAVASFGNQDLDAAVTYANSALQQTPNDLEALALLASVQAKLGQWTEAQPLFERLLVAHPKDASTLVQLGHCQLELKQFQAAVDTLNRALLSDPTVPLAHFFLSRAYAGLSNAAESRHQAELHARMLQELTFEVPKAQQQQQAQLSARAQKLLVAGREADAVHLFQTESAGAKSSPALAWLAVGATWLQMGRIESAQHALQQALQLDTTIKGAHTYLGLAALQADDLPRAEKEFLAELKGDPNHPEALAEMGAVRYRQGRWEEAATYFVKSKSGSPRFLYMLTDAYFHLGKSDVANLTAESLAAHAHSRPEVMASLNDLLRRNGQDALAERIAHP